MNEPDKRIVKFIKEHHVLTLATAIENQPYISHCYFVYLSEENVFIFTSDKKTRHINQIEKNQKVAAGIALETKVVGKIRGLQITGKVEEATGDWLSKTKIAYLKKYPFALLHIETMWLLKPDFFKLTDNRLGFGTKIIWIKE